MCLVFFWCLFPSPAEETASEVPVSSLTNGSISQHWPFQLNCLGDAFRFSLFLEPSPPPPQNSFPHNTELCLVASSGGFHIPYFMQLSGLLLFCLFVCVLCSTGWNPGTHTPDKCSLLNHIPTLAGCSQSCNHVPMDGKTELHHHVSRLTVLGVEMTLWSLEVR